MQHSRYRVLILDPAPGWARDLASQLDGQDGFAVAGHDVDTRLEMPFSAVTVTHGTARSPAPDAVLIDPAAFSLSPPALLALVRDALDAAPLAVGVTNAEGPALARTCLAHGFHGFLAKTARLETYFLCLAALRAGAVFIDAPYVAALRTTPAAPPPPPARSLTEREAYVLRSVALGKSLKEIGYELSLSSKTVETYKARGTAKLNITGRREIVEYAIRAGWV